MMSRVSRLPGFWSSVALRIMGNNAARKSARENLSSSPSGQGKSFRHKFRPGRHWWLFLAAIVFVCYYLFQVYCVLLGPKVPGFWMLPGQERGLLKIEVSPGTPAERAGLRTGDLLLSFDGYPLRTVTDFGAMVANLETGRSHSFGVERGGQRLEFLVKVERVRPASRTPFIIWQAVSFFLLITALFIAFKKPGERLALLGALALASLSISMAWWDSLPWGGAAIWRKLPILLGALLWLPRLASFSVGPIMLTFFALFPRPLFRRSWPLLAIWLPALTWVPGYLIYVFNLVYRPAQAFGHEILAIRPVRILGLYFLASLLALIFNYFQLKDINERRRLRVLLVGGAVGVLPGVLRYIIWESNWPPGLFRWLASGVPDVMIAVIFIFFPLSFAYSILKHHLLDIKLLVRQGLRYALARGALLAVVPVLGIVLVADLLVHGNQPFIEILKIRGWIYLVVLGLATGLHSQRQRWARAIDRKFFREQYDARQLLRELAIESARARSFPSAAEVAVVRISRALHPSFVSVMYRASGQKAFLCLAVSPPDWNVPPMAAEGSFASRLRAADRTLDLTQIELLADGTVSQHPGSATVTATRTLGSTQDTRPTEYETEWLRAASASLLVPIGMNPHGNEAILVLGQKLSEEPYTREDRELLEAVASNLVLPLERQSRPTTPSTGVFEECPRCGTCWDSGSSSCEHDGASLTIVPLPRTLAGRYRLERRLGTGGMGTVYEARDGALGRRVAVKVLREDYVHSAAAASRFEREARAAAALDHPNVVSVFDYGVEGGTRAFLVMELLQGSTLRDYLWSRGKLEPEFILEVFRQVCQAVGAAHRNRLIHRDLKPENIFICAGTEEKEVLVKVLDFGVAKFLDLSEESGAAQDLMTTASGVLVGTPAYMSPEQLLGEKPSVTWDLWALAVSVYESLTGSLPFPVKDREMWRRSVLAGEYVPLNQRLHGVTGRLEEFFARALAVDRSKRPGTASEFFKQLERALS